MRIGIGRLVRRAMPAGVAATFALTLFTAGYAQLDGHQPGLSRVNEAAPRAEVEAYGFDLVLVQDKVEPPQDKAELPKKDGKATKQDPPKLGLLVNDPKAFAGYTLLAPMNSTKTYLIDMHGKVVRTWESDCTPALTAFLLENGHLLRPGTSKGGQKGMGGPGAGGRIQEFTWEGELVWDYKFTSDKQAPHHDVTKLPNGNVLVIAWDKKTNKEAIAAGRKPELVGSGDLLPDCLLEIKPTGKTTGEIVWEWHLWDHLVQDLDANKPNYGPVAEHPELVDINYGEDQIAPVVAKKGGLDLLKTIGYLGNAKGRGNPDWTHCNSVAYNADLDQIVVSVHNFSEIWIIDHGTTAKEAAGHTGGRYGKGGDLLYRWGNPRAYHAGTKKEQTLFAQHCAYWIPKGFPGAGHMLVFNNGNRRSDGNYSSVDEIVLPVDAEGRYAYKPGTAYGPEKAVWSYRAAKKSDFFAVFISGAQRLPNGNTLICSGPNGTVFEVTPANEVVWKYVNPVKGGPGPGGPGGMGPIFGGPRTKIDPPQPGQLLPSFASDMLKLTAEQKKQLTEFQKDVTGKLNKILTEEQIKQMKNAKPGFGPGGFGTPPQPGQILSSFFQSRLKLTDDQKKQVDELQKEADARLDKVLAEDQKKRLKGMSGGGFAFGGPPGGFGPGGFGPPGGASLFRAYRYGPGYPGLVGRDLTPGQTIEELQKKETKEKTKEKK